MRFVTGDGSPRYIVATAHLVSNILNLCIIYTTTNRQAERRVRIAAKTHN